jgi:hypothetical protein
LRLWFAKLVQRLEEAGEAEEESRADFAEHGVIP